MYVGRLVDQIEHDVEALESISSKLKDARIKLASSSSKKDELPVVTNVADPKKEEKKKDGKID